MLFTDVTGSTRLADRLDVEELRDVMSEWFAAVRAEIEAQGGTVEKYIGDAVMAVFGVPTAHEDDPARALRAALGIRRRLVEVNEGLEQVYGITMEIRTGINTGEAVATLDPPPGEAIVTGVAVNAAARLEQLAEPGQTLVAERTARAAPGFAFEDLGEQQLRGKDEPVRAFLLVAEKANAEIRGLPGMHAPLVGRDGELDLLLTLQERVVAERRPHLVTIYGEPGVGKSRLVRELLRRLEGARILAGRCLSYGDGVTYWPLAEILKSVAGLSDDDPASVAVERIEELCAELMPGVPFAAAALAFTVGLDTGDEEFARLPPSAVRVELHRTWRTLLSVLAEREPLVVVIDDIHWADPALLELLEELADRSQGPLLFVCPARPELTGTHPTWGGGRRTFSAVFLSPLGREEATELVARLLDVDGLNDETREAILARAEGNPFFLEEILRQLIDERRIVREGGRWKATESLPTVELPDTVQGVLAARIDLLQPREKHTLQQASVVGRIFWRGAVAALVDDRDTLDPDLRLLEERELVAVRIGSTMVGEEELAFSHILTRDVAYESLPRRERPRAHARVARWIEETTGDRQREYGALLAHHYVEAYRGARRDRAFPEDELEALRLRAFELLLVASQSAVRGAAYRSARALAETALELARVGEERASAFEALGHCARHSGLGDDAWAAYSRAVDALREDGSSDFDRIGRLSGFGLETAVRWSGTMVTVPDEEVSLRYLDYALEHLDEADSEARVRLMTAMAFWQHGYPSTQTPYSDPVRAEQVGRAAADMALRLGRPELAVVALDSVQHCLQRQHRYGDAMESGIERLELAKNAADLDELGDSYAVAAWNAVFFGAFHEARELGLEGHERLRVDGPLYAAHCLSWAAFASFYLGLWDEVLEGYELLVAALSDLGKSLTSGFISPWAGMAFVFEARGDHAAADRCLADVEEIELRREGLSSMLTPLVVATLLLRDEVGAARSRLDRVYEEGLRLDNLPLLRLAEGELLARERRWDEAVELAEGMRRLHATSAARYLPPAADRLAGRAAIGLGKTEDGLALLRSAAAGYDALGMAVEAAVTRLDAAEAGAGDAPALVAEALPPLQRAGYLRQLTRAASLS